MMVKKFVELSIENLYVDAELGVDIFDKNGKLLMPAGAILSQQSIDKLISREIRQVTVVETEKLNPEQRAVLVTEIEKTINHGFRKCNEIPLMNDLRNALINYQIKKLDG